MPKHDDGTEYSSHMEDDVKFKRVGTREFQAEDFTADFKMAAAADRKILGKSLDYA